MTIKERVARWSDRLCDRLRHRSAFAIGEGDGIDGDFAALRDHTYAVVVTFRRNGEAVPSPVWFGVNANGHAYVHTVSHAGKVKRLRRDSRVLIAPSTMRGKPVGPAIKATGRVLPKDEWAHAEEALAAAYGVGRKVFERLLGGQDDPSAYIEITPGR